MTDINTLVRGPVKKRLTDVQRRAIRDWPEDAKLVTMRDMGTRNNAKALGRKGLARVAHSDRGQQWWVLTELGKQVQSELRS